MRLMFQFQETFEEIKLYGIILSCFIGAAKWHYLRGVVPIVEERDKRKRGVLNLRKKTRFSLISSTAHN